MAPTKDETMKSSAGSYPCRKMHAAAMAAILIALNAVVTHSKYTAKQDDVVYSVYPGNRFEYQKIDYVFSRNSVIPLFLKDSICAFPDVNLIGQKIHANWSRLKSRKRIIDSSNVICDAGDAGGTELQSGGDTLFFGGLEVYDSASAVIYNEIKSSVQIIDKDFRSGLGKRFLDSSQVHTFAERTGSIQRRIDSIISAGETLNQTMRNYYNKTCEQYLLRRASATSEYRTDFGAHIECKEK